MTSQEILTAGTLLGSGTYRIERVLGQGGFGITYLATDLNLNRLVAIKEFFPKTYCTREGETGHVSVGASSAISMVSTLKAKFLKEARNIAKYDHPGIIRIYSAFEENNTAYYVMEYIEGSSLAAIVEKGAPLPADEAVAYINRVGEALDYVHSLKMCHLDVKPANVMVRDKNSAPVLIDFGLSKQYDSGDKETSTTLMGLSHGYAPWEQYTGGGLKTFSPETDVYSLGATLYFLLTGQTPPDAAAVMEDGVPESEKIPAHLMPVIKKAMAPKRKNRYESVADFLAALNSAKPSKKQQAKPKVDNSGSKPTEILKPQGKDSNSSRKWVYVSLGAAVVAILVAGFLFLAPSNQPEPIPPGPVVNDSITDPTFADLPKHVNNKEIETRLGTCSYSGEVNDAGLPDGVGTATWAKGASQYGAKEYVGEWKNGKMTGTATYTQYDGIKFEGSFKDDYYTEGRLTLPDGDYFVGKYKNGQPDESTGKWHSAK